jgi:hypothetical protein
MDKFSGADQGGGIPQKIAKFPESSSRMIPLSLMGPTRRNRP